MLLTKPEVLKRLGLQLPSLYGRSSFPPRHCANLFPLLERVEDAAGAALATDGSSDQLGLHLAFSK